MSEVMDTWIIWLVAACVLLLIEVLSQAVWAFCFAAGCLVALLLSLFTDSLAVQGIAVAVAAIAAWLLLAPVVRRWERRNERQTRTGMDALLGRRATVTEEIRPPYRARTHRRRQLAGGRPRYRHPDSCGRGGSGDSVRQHNPHSKTYISL